MHCDAKALLKLWSWSDCPGSSPG